MSGLHLRDIAHAFGKHQVLNGVSVDVAPGELVCLLGPSGCGKTTLLRIAAGLEQVQSGTVSIDDSVVGDGESGGHLPPEKRGVGLMFQDYALFPHLNVRDNIGFGMDDARGDPRAWTDAALAGMGMAAYADAFPHTLSGGQQQRVALLRALAPDPKVLLLDEPFSGLDVARRAHIRAETLMTIKDAGVATLMVTHDPEEAMFMADRILVMDAGRVLQDGTPMDLYFKPNNVFVAELFGPVNRFTGTVADGRVATPLGSFDAGSLADGSDAEVLVRPEAIGIAETGTVAIVAAARPLGVSSFIVLTLEDGRRIEARMPGTVLPHVGSRVLVAVNPGQALVFAKSGTR